MIQIGVQTQNVVDDKSPCVGFEMLKRTGFGCCDFSLNTYLKNTDIYKGRLNEFFLKSENELIRFFTPHKQAASAANIVIHQMHMPYPIYIPNKSGDINDFLLKTVVPKSIAVCTFLECRYMVVHGIKLDVRYAEEEEWKLTEEFIYSMAEYAKENNVVLCMENLYKSSADRLVEGPCCDAKKAAERIDAINDKMKAEVVGFCYDTGHANLIGLDSENFITTLGERLKALHIHDNDGFMDLHQIPYTFTKTRENISSTDWDGFIRGLKNISFDGALSFETAPVLKSFPDEMKETVLSFIADIGRFFALQISG